MYKLIYSEPFFNDIDGLYEYIEDDYEAENARRKVFILLDKKLDDIELMPYAWALVKDDNLSVLGYRFSLIKNFLLFFIINEDDKIIEIVRFLPSQMDWASILIEDIETN